MKFWVVVAVFALSILSTSSQLTTWDNQLFDFGWSPYNPTIPACSSISNSWNDRRTANPASTPPYTMTVYCGGYQPIVIATVQGLGYNWTVGLPTTNGPYILSMKDANGYTGGDSLVFTVTDGPVGVTCPATGTFNANSLQITSTGTNAECSEVVIKTTGGTAPYTMQIVGAQRPPKTTTWTTSEMSYTIDMQPSEQFFVIVTDANGLNGVEGLHTVTNGDTGCYALATTVSAASLPTTLSFDPSSTVSFPSGNGSTSALPSSLTVIENTATTTVVSTVTGTDGSQSIVTLAPGAFATVAAFSSPTSSTPTPLPAIIGGAVGGAVLLLFLVILFLWWRRRAARAKQARRQEIYDRRRLSDPPEAVPATYVNPYTPPTPGRDTAPLMGHMSSTYSSGSGVTGSAYTTGPNQPAMAYFGTQNTLTTASRDEPSPLWTRPAVSPSTSSGYNHHGDVSSPLTESSSMPPGSGNVVVTRPEGLPPGAMVPQILGGRTHEKATFVPSKTGTPAPPPYSHGT